MFEVLATNPAERHAHKAWRSFFKDATQRQRAVTGLINFFMVVALGLLAVGLYGTLSFYVQQRTREMGVRVAVGAVRRDIMRLVLGKGARWVALGIVIGIAGALGFATLLRAIIYGVNPLSPLTLLVASGVVAFAGLVACWLPALRAAGVGPMEALRAD